MPIRGSKVQKSNVSSNQNLIQIIGSLTVGTYFFIGLIKAVDVLAADRLNETYRDRATEVR